MIRLLLALLIGISSSASAIVIRDDVDDSNYRVKANEFPALVDLPGEGHGVLIASQWIVTAAHAVTWKHEVKEVVLGGEPRKVERLIIHPGYKKLSQEIVNQALRTGDASRIMKILASSDDIALLKLASPASGITPAALYRRNDELGKVIEIIGKGATGTGVSGQGFHASHRTDLRRAFNKITSAGGRWLDYTFSRPPSGHALEGVTGSGDSGGPVLIQVENQWELAGLASWNGKFGQSSLLVTRPGVYGQIFHAVRISHYIDWIERTISATK